MPEDVRDFLLGAVREYDAEFRAKAEAFGDYTVDDIQAFKAKLAKALAYLG